MTRVALYTETYRDDRIASDHEAIAAKGDLIARSSIDRPSRLQHLRDLAFMHPKLLLCCYFRGDAREYLRARMTPFLDCWEASERLMQQVCVSEKHRIQNTCLVYPRRT